MRCIETAKTYRYTLGRGTIDDLLDARDINDVPEKDSELFRRDNINADRQ